MPEISSASVTGFFSCIDLMRYGACQIRCSHTGVDCFGTYFFFVVYVLRAFETRRKAAFEIVEVCRCARLSVFLIPFFCTNKMPDVDSRDSSSGIAVDVQQRLNCALP